jgi:glycerol-3-phosphate dehydrogenase
LPYGELTLIGTTDIGVDTPGDATISDEEMRYLCDAANRYFERQIAPADIIWSYAGIRALYDDGAADAQNVTRDYHLELDPAPGPKLLSVFGGKVTTARALASDALDKLGVGGMKFTRTAALPGGDIAPGFNDRLAELSQWVPAPLLSRLARSYGTRLERILDGASATADLGRHFGAGLHEAEVRYLVQSEFARTADDILWRRSKLGLAMTKSEQAALAKWLGTQASSDG